jgi:O-antigen/teichoic acid export membrane protein
MPFAVWGLFTWLQGASDRWALQALTSSSQVGLYAIVAQIGAYPLTLVGAMVYQVAGPIIYARVGTGGDPAGLRSAAYTCSLLAAGIVGVTLVLVAIAAVAHREIFDLLVAPEFRGVSVLLPIAVASAGLFNAGQILTLVPLASGNSRNLLAPKIGTAGVAVALNVGAAYMFGVAGVVTAGLIFALIFDAWVIWVAVAALKGASGHVDPFGLVRAEL